MRQRGQLAEEQLQPPDAAPEQHADRSAGILHADQPRRQDNHERAAEDLEYQHIDADIL